MILRYQNNFFFLVQASLHRARHAGGSEYFEGAAPKPWANASGEQTWSS